MYNFLNNNLSPELKQLLYSFDNTMKIKKGSFLFQEGMPANELYVVRSGSVRLSKISYEGKELTLNLCSAGDIIGDINFYVTNSKHLFNAKVIESGEVAILNKEALEEHLMVNSVLALEYMKWMSERIRHIQTKFRDLLLYGKKGAIYSTIIRLITKHGEEQDKGDMLINTTISFQELALYSGTSRENVSRMVNDLRRRKILSLIDGKIVVHDLNYLRQEISCDLCPKEICVV
jgi:CRP/FNR family transcriptional regulator